ncbi:type II toxin-antitoxin system HicA family toxin [Granulicella arctica]|uniref:Putative RNA binding protein YcfA (HicA-like mRNA interferase family) n=1 Tax=Granulicella arctica TaxID=940613 RepID=A0A7Y9TJ88_9BACT|nr:putative RNA binding protein YcfA (HicA-like mRNA interferase family) [Granulicella arctica]
MSRHDKLIVRLRSKPSDFTWSELLAVMTAFGYELKTTGGSARKLIHSKTRATLMMHEPHPSKVLKAYQVRDAIQFLKQEGHIQ